MSPAVSRLSCCSRTSPRQRICSARRNSSGGLKCWIPTWSWQENFSATCSPISRETRSCNCSNRNRSRYLTHSLLPLPRWKPHRVHQPSQTAHRTHHLHPLSRSLAGAVWIRSLSRLDNQSRQSRIFPPLPGRATAPWISIRGAPSINSPGNQPPASRLQRRNPRRRENHPLRRNQEHPGSRKTSLPPRQPIPLLCGTVHQLRVRAAQPPVHGQQKPTKKLLSPRRLHGSIC